MHSSPLQKLLDFLRLLGEEYGVWSRYDLPSPDEIDKIRQEQNVAVGPGDEAYWVEVDEGRYSPKAIEVLRVLRHLKQRFKTDDMGRLLVGDWRVEVRERWRPPRRVKTGNLEGHQREIAEIGARVGLSEWSEFQVEGWKRVFAVIQNADQSPKGDKKAPSRLVITAPTGAGKTEVFLLPILYQANFRRKRSPSQRQSAEATTLLVYPRLALLKDQLGRVLRYAAPLGLTVGVQFEGIGERDDITRKKWESLRDSFRCPCCGSPLEWEADQHSGVRELRCEKGHTYRMTLSREAHVNTPPDVLLTTVESLDSLYLRPKADALFQQGLAGIVLDEAHLYESLYGAHVANLVRRIVGRSNRHLFLIASSATIANPEDFGGKLLGGEVVVHSYDPDQHGRELSGLEVVYFLQVHPEQKNAAALLIQTLMALGHGVFGEGEIVVAFNDSLDGIYRFEDYLKDADQERRLFAFRTLLDQIQFKDKCPRTAPARCPIYSQGECWRGLFGAKACQGEIRGIRENPLEIATYTRRGRQDFSRADVVLATSSLEVGVDEEGIQGVVQYGPPRTPAALTQRRGRAARRNGQIAYNLVLLGLDLADNFVLSHRKRILDGQVEPPLNPGNPVIEKLHEYLDKERNTLQSYHLKHNIIKGTLQWVHWRLRQCQEAQSLASGFIDRLEKHSNSSSTNKDTLEKYIVPGLKNALKALLEHNQRVIDFSFALQEEEYAEFGQEVADAARSANEILAKALEDTSRIPELEGSLEDLFNLLRKQDTIRTPQEKRDRISKRLGELKSLFEKVQEHLAKANPASLETRKRHYAFLRELYDWLDSGYAFISPPQDLKAVSRALFLLHQGLPKGHHSCGSWPPALVPNAYFEQLRPIAFWHLDNDPNKRFAIELESPLSLERFFPPYRLQYRYNQGSRVFTLPLEPVGKETVGGKTVYRVRVSPNRVQGVKRPDGGLEVESVTLRHVDVPPGGRPIVAFCENCGQIGSHWLAWRSCRCGGNYIAVHLYPGALGKSRFEARNPRRITETLLLTGEKGGSGEVLILGSEVEASKYIKKDGEWIRVKHEPWTFEARLEEPLVYTLNHSHGVGIDLHALAERIGAGIDEIAPTAAAFFRKVISGVAGVSPDLLKASDPDEKGHMWIWELVEGGGGITQLFERTLMEEPHLVYAEMVRAATCPVVAAERALQKGTDVRNELTLPEWYEKVNPELVEEIAREAEQTKARLEGEPDSRESALKHGGEANDGCPACFRTGRGRAEEPAARHIAELLLEAFTWVASAQELKERREKSVKQGLLPPVLLHAEEGRYYVLLL